jgi:putative endonuclease
LAKIGEIRSFFSNEFYELIGGIGRLVIPEEKCDLRHEAVCGKCFNRMSFELDDIGEEFYQRPVKLSSKELAHVGEEHAAKHIASLGYRIVKRNFRYGRVGEIDIVAYDGDCLVFIEVKARQDHSHGTPEASIDGRKQAQLKRVAKMYYYVNALSDVVCRFDVVAVDVFDRKADIRHHINAFY